MALTADDFLEQKSLSQLSEQLVSLEALLDRHPLTSEKLIILQTTLNSLNLQTQWSSAGPLDRLLLTLQTAFKGHQSSTSAAGFIGPHLDRFQQATALLMQAVVGNHAIGKNLLLSHLNQVIVEGLIYLTTQTLGSTRESFPKQDPGAARKASFLFRELGLTFLFGSRMISELYKSIAKGLDLNKQDQKLISDMGLFQAFVLIVILTDDGNKKDEELVDSLHRFITPTIDSLENVLLKAASQNKIDDHQFFTANTQLQLIRIALSKHEIEFLQQTIENSFEAFDLPYQAIKDDLKKITQICDQINLSFSLIFNPREMTVTNMTQAA